MLKTVQTEGQVMQGKSINSKNGIINCVLCVFYLWTVEYTCLYISITAADSLVICVIYNLVIDGPSCSFGIPAFLHVVVPFNIIGSYLLCC